MKGIIAYNLVSKLFISVVIQTSIVLAQESTTTKEKPEPKQESEIKPYEKVINKDAKTSKGVFTVHKVKEKYFYEIHKEQLGKDFLWVTQIAKTTIGVGYGGQVIGNRVVKWERQDNRILLRNIKYDIVSDPKLPIAQAVKAANNDAILMSFNIEALGKDDAPVIDVTKLFATEVAEFSARTRLKARGFDPARSFVERITPYSTNIEVDSAHTYYIPLESGGTQPQQIPSLPPTPFLGYEPMRGNSATVSIHHSMVALPEHPMMPRLFDERVGYYSVSQLDFSKDEQKVSKRTYITRWRLEKKDLNAELSEPIKPITYYIDPATPTKWIPYIKKGIEDWQPAFEAAGFKNAIIAKDAPEDDPNWSPEDVRYSVVRWLPSIVENAVGPHVHDPRTGEILHAHIQIYQNVLNLHRIWYFLQVGHLDPRGQQFPFPDDLMGELLRHVVAHEVGHTLGFQHNMKSSSLYSLDQVRSAEWVKGNGHVASLMDYSRFNYVAQVEDKIAIEDLIPKIGPYDKWATMWGYKPIDRVVTSDDEKKMLDQWTQEQDKTPWLRFSTNKSGGSDPGELRESVGDADVVRATELGLKNLKRTINLILPAATKKTDETYDELEELYNKWFIWQWRIELGHVVNVVGGFDSQQKRTGQDGVIFTPTAKIYQVEAVKFLNKNAFVTPNWMIKPELLRRIEPNGMLNRIKSAQMAILKSLLDSKRFERLIEQENIDGVNSYKVNEFLSDIRYGIWSELYERSSYRIDAFRRNIQRSWIEIIDEKLNGRTLNTSPVSDDQRPLLRSELRAVNAQIIKCLLSSTIDPITRSHLEDIKDQISKTLNPVPLLGTDISKATSVVGTNDDSRGGDYCWIDHPNNN